ncbi:MAG: cation diffusion facilitator family transporter [Candidatus Bathyarchaeia archaeon]
MIDASRSGKSSAIKYSMLAILSVFLVESSLGLAIGSLAILSDGFHALFDFISMLILFISIQASSKPPDEDHMYGHEKFEYLGGMVGGITLIILAAAITLEATLRIIAGEPYIRGDLSLIGYIALAYTFSIDIVRVFILGPRVSEDTPVVKAAFYHAFSDLCSTLIALLGLWSSSYGVFYGDPLTSLILSAVLIFLSVRLVWSNIMELSDMAPKEAVEKIREQIIETSGMLLAYENLKIRKVGKRFFIRATLKFPDYIGLEEAHNIATEIEKNISRVLGEADVSFHIEPSGTEGVSTREFIRRIASGVEGVVDAHDVDIARHDGRTYVSLHIRVDPNKPLSKAHEVAEKVEEAIYVSMKDVEGVFVHIEPSNIELSRGSMISDQEMNRIIQSIIEEYGGKIKAKYVVTYLTEGKRQVNIKCTFDEDVPIEEAHKVALEIEDGIERKLSETKVTVHMEPGGD